MVRFEEVPPPLEERVGQSLLARVRDAVALGIDARNRFNASVHDEELKERTASAVFDAMRPGTAPFVLLVATILAMLVHQLLLHRETQRILREQTEAASASSAPSPGS